MKNWKRKNSIWNSVSKHLWICSFSLLLFITMMKQYFSIFFRNKKYIAYLTQLNRLFTMIKYRQKYNNNFIMNCTLKKTEKYLCCSHLQTLRLANLNIRCEKCCKHLVRWRKVFAFGWWKANEKYKKKEKKRWWFG